MSIIIFKKRLMLLIIIKHSQNTRHGFFLLHNSHVNIIKDYQYCTSSFNLFSTFEKDIIIISF